LHYICKFTWPSTFNKIINYNANILNIFCDFWIIIQWYLVRKGDLVFTSLDSLTDKKIWKTSKEWFFFMFIIICCSCCCCVCQIKMAGFTLRCNNWKQRINMLTRHRRGVWRKMPSEIKSRKIYCRKNQSTNLNVEKTKKQCGKIFMSKKSKMQKKRRRILGK
jgi:hypothetical protein